MRFVNGNILTPNTEEHGVIVCHQVNCQGVMGAGLAKQIKIRFPRVFMCYREKCRHIKSGAGGVGDVQFCSVVDKAGYIIANIFGQEGYGQDKPYTDYASLHKAFNTIAKTFPSYTIRIPYLMGCGLGGGSWDTVYQIIQNTLVVSGVEVEIWRLQ